ncbi:helix-turn-helix domain-containing protein [Desulfobotulus alkaliphilus]
MNEMADRWWSINEICKNHGVSNDSVYKWIDRHNMPAHRIGRLWKFKKSQVDAWVESGAAAEPGSGASPAPTSCICVPLPRPGRTSKLSNRLLDNCPGAITWCC